MRKLFTFLCAALMSVGMFAEPTQQDLSLNYTEWEGVGGSVSLTPESMLKCIVMEAPGGMELRWNAGEDFSGWDKIVIEVHSMTNCDGNYYRLLGYLRDASESANTQKRGEISTKLPGDGPAMITMDLRRKSALGDFDLTQVRVLGIQSQVAGSEFVIKRVYLEKSNIPFDPKGTLNFVELTAEMVSEWENDETIFSAADLPGFSSVTPEQAQTWSPTDTEVSSQLYYDFEESRAANYLNSNKGQTPNAGASVQQRKDVYRTIKTFGGKVYYTTGYTNSGDPEPEPTTYTLQLVVNDTTMGAVAIENPSSDIVKNEDGSFSVPEGLEVAIKAEPKEGYRLAGWREGNIDELNCYYCGKAINTKDNPYKVKLTADKAIMAVFEKKPELTYLAVKLPATAAPADDKVELVGTFEGGKISLKKVETGYFMNENIQASENQVFKIRDAANENKVLCKFVPANEGEGKWVQAIFKFGNYWKDDTYKGTPCKWFELDISDEAQYGWKEDAKEPDTLKLELAVSDAEMGTVVISNLLGSGIISLGEGKYEVPEDVEVSIKAEPKEGYKFAGWKEGDTAVNTMENPWKRYLQKDVTITATFEKVEDQAIDNTAVETKATKRIVNGQLVIEKNGKLFDVTGAEVR